LVKTLLETYPDMLPENFRSQYVKCTKSKGFTSPSSEYKWLYLTETRYCSTQWIKVRSNQVLQVCKSPFDQVEAFRNDLEEFWPYVEPTAATPAICKSLSSFNQLVTQSKSRLKRAPLSAAAASITKKSKVNAVSDGNGSTNKVLFMAATGVQVETVVDNGCGDDMEVNHDAEDLFGSSMIDAAFSKERPTFLRTSLNLFAPRSLSLTPKQVGCTHHFRSSQTCNCIRRW